MYESIELYFTNVSDLQKEKKFRGIINNIDYKVKKIVLKNDAIKEEFKNSKFYQNVHLYDLSKKGLLVSVEVKYNPNGNIGSYTITEIISEK